MAQVLVTIGPAGVVSGSFASESGQVHHRGGVFRKSRGARY